MSVTNIEATIYCRGLSYQHFFAVNPCQYWVSADLGS